jgi:hypothetical protein
VLINRIHNQNWNINCLTNSKLWRKFSIFPQENPLFFGGKNHQITNTKICRFLNNVVLAAPFLVSRGILKTYRLFCHIKRGQVLGGWLMIRPYLTTMLPLQLVFIAGGAHARKSMWYLHPASWYLDLGCPNTIT